MRRENSKFNAAFVSYEGSKLFNNDYYGSAELDRFACYVIADGLESGDIESSSARLAVQAAISAFHESPSMSVRALKRYVNAADKVLKENRGHQNLRASITVVVTDYQKIRYAWAGNTRFYLYRAGRVFNESADHSLSRQMASRGELPLDKIARHEERDNLTIYVGHPEGLTPQVSDKIKLQDGDIYMLLTRGIWEQCDAGDIRAALDSAENYPNLALDYLERLLLDPHPDDIDNYSAAVVFVDKVFIDPNRGKKIKRILMIAIPVLVVLIAVVILLIVLNNRKNAKIENMNTAFISAVEYIGDNNYPRASGDLTTALRLAEEVRDREFRAMADSYQKLVDAIINADDLFSAGDYEGAQAAYLTALDRSRFTDNFGQAYIQRRLTQTGGFLSVRDLIAQGDALAANDNHILAEGRFLDARRLATGINDADGRRLAMEALQKLYESMERNEATAQGSASQQSQALQDAAEMEIAGDRAVADRDLISARLFYDIARERFLHMEDMGSVARIDSKLQSLVNMQAQDEQQAAAAATLVTEGDAAFDDGNFVEARIRYIQARNIYARLNDTGNLAIVLAKIDMCDIIISGIAASVPQASPTDPAPPGQELSYNVEITE